MSSVNSRSFGFLQSVITCTIVTASTITGLIVCSSGAQSAWSLLLLSLHAAVCFTDGTRGRVDSKEREVKI